MKKKIEIKRERCFRWLKKANALGKHCDSIPGEICPRDTTKDCWETKKRKSIKPSL